MLFLIIQTIIILYIIFAIYSIIEIKKYNKNGLIVDLNNDNDNNIKVELLSLNPILIHKNINVDSEYLLNHYSNIMINNNDNFISIKNLFQNDTINIFKNKNLLKDTDLKDKINFDMDIFENLPLPILLYQEHSLSFLKGDQLISKQFCKHNINILIILEGEITIYLINPKHKDDIMNKDLQSIKKYSHKYILKKDNIFIIPPNWYYFQENTNNLTIQYHIDASNIFTFHYNYLR